jgi:hypothetical protein
MQNTDPLDLARRAFDDWRCNARDTMLYKLLKSAQKRWKRNLLNLVVNKVKFKDGEKVQDQSNGKVA